MHRSSLSQRGAPRRAQRGIALLTAIFVVALATIAAVAMVSDAAIAIHRAANLQDSEQEEWYALGVEAWVCQLLAEAAQLQQSDHPDGLGDTWAQPMTLPVDHGVVSGRLEDLQGRFNLNNLASKNPQPYLDQFTRLLEDIPGVDPYAAADLGPAIRDWIDQDNERTGSGGAEDDYYLSLDVPYRTANQLMKSPSELHAVRGMTPALYTALLPYVATLPETDTAINVNTAPLPVLQSLTSQPSGALAEFAQTRVKTPIDKQGDIGSSGLFPTTGQQRQVPLDVKTSYFQLQASISIGDGHLLMLSTIKRNGGTGQNPVQVLRHSFGAE